MIHWNERAAAALRDRGVSKAEVGRNMKPKVSGQAISLKLQGKRPVSVDELQVIARLAGMTVAELLGDDVIIDLEDEKDLILLYRLLSPTQRTMLVQVAQQFLAARKDKTSQGDS